MIYTARNPHGSIRNTDSISDARCFMMQSGGFEEDTPYDIKDIKGKTSGSILCHATSYYWKDNNGIYRLLNADGTFTEGFVPTDLPPGEIPNFIVCDNPFKTIEAARCYIQTVIVPSVPSDQC